MSSQASTPQSASKPQTGPIPSRDLLDVLENHDPMEDVHQRADRAQLEVMLTLIANEVESLCGAYYAHDDQHNGRFKRWGYNQGSIRIRSDRVRIQVPRVRDTETNQMHTLESYPKLRRATSKMEENLADKVFLGIHLRDYDRVSREFAESFGLSPATVSRAFQQYSAQVLKEFEERDLSQDTYVALLLDATWVQKKNILICIGVTVHGEKHVLGIVELSTENAEVISGFLLRLVDKGLRYSQGLLFVMDGSKGMKKAVQEVFGDDALIQRCIWHKRENVVDKIQGEEARKRLRNQLNKAYHQDGYAQAKPALNEIVEQLEMDGENAAANSLREGMEETLTLHRLGIGKELRKSLRTNNIMENLNRNIKERLARIRRWVSSDQCHRWIVMALIEAEKKLEDIEHTDQLAALQRALSEETSKAKLIPLGDPKKITNFNSE